METILSFVNWGAAPVERYTGFAGTAEEFQITDADDTLRWWDDEWLYDFAGNTDEEAPEETPITGTYFPNIISHDGDLTLSDGDRYVIKSRTGPHWMFGWAMDPEGYGKEGLLVARNASHKANITEATTPPSFIDTYSGDSVIAAEFSPANGITIYVDGKFAGYIRPQDHYMSSLTDGAICLGAFYEMLSDSEGEDVPNQKWFTNLDMDWAYVRMGAYDGALQPPNTDAPYHKDLTGEILGGGESRTVQYICADTDFFARALSPQMAGLPRSPFRPFNPPSVPPDPLIPCSTIWDSLPDLADYRDLDEQETLVSSGSNIMDVCYDIPCSWYYAQADEQKIPLPPEDYMDANKDVIVDEDEIGKCFNYQPELPPPPKPPPFPPPPPPPPGGSGGGGTGSKCSGCNRWAGVNDEYNLNWAADSVEAFSQQEAQWVDVDIWATRRITAGDVSNIRSNNEYFNLSLAYVSHYTLSKEQGDAWNIERAIRPCFWKTRLTFRAYPSDFSEELFGIYRGRCEADIRICNNDVQTIGVNMEFTYGQKEIVRENILLRRNTILGEPTNIEHSDFVDFTRWVPYGSSSEPIGYNGEPYDAGRHGRYRWGMGFYGFNRTGTAEFDLPQMIPPTNSYKVNIEIYGIPYMGYPNRWNYRVNNSSFMMTHDCWFLRDKSMQINHAATDSEDADKLKLGKVDLLNKPFGEDVYALTESTPFWNFQQNTRYRFGYNTEWNRHILAQDGGGWYGPQQWGTTGWYGIDQRTLVSNHIKIKKITWTLSGDLEVFGGYQFT